MATEQKDAFTEDEYILARNQVNEMYGSGDALTPPDINVCILQQIIINRLSDRANQLNDRLERVIASVQFKEEPVRPTEP